MLLVQLKVGLQIFLLSSLPSAQSEMPSHRLDGLCMQLLPPGHFTWSSEFGGEDRRIGRRGRKCGMKKGVRSESPQVTDRHIWGCLCFYSTHSPGMKPP